MQETPPGHFSLQAPLFIGPPADTAVLGAGPVVLIDEIKNAGVKFPQFRRHLMVALIFSLPLRIRPATAPSVRMGPLRFLHAILS